MGWLSILAGPIVAAIQAITGIVRDRYDSVRERQFLSHEKEMMVETQKQVLALDAQAKNTLWGLEQIRRSDKWMRRSLFVLTLLPLMLGPFFPEQVGGYFDNVMTAVPEWYRYMVLAMVAAVWGMPGIAKMWGGRNE